MNKTDKPTLDHYYEKQDVLTRECLLSLKGIILGFNAEIIHIRKYQIPFFTYRNFNLAFLWVHRKKIMLGFVTDKRILGQKKDEIRMLEFKPSDDIPLEEIRESLSELIVRYDDFKNGK